MSGRPKDTPRPDFKVGDRVYIAGKNHPWHGSSGRIVASWQGSQSLGLDWEVQLDQGDYEGHQVAAASSELQPERREA